jgi:transcriptional regulator with XRE-family HTH domain
MTLTDKIRAFRTIKNLTQDNIAQMIGISSTAYAKLERGETEMTYLRLEQISDALGVRVSDLINFGENGFYYMNNSTNNSPYGVNINNASKETTELIIEVKTLRAEKEGFIKQIEHLNKIISLLESQI